MRGLLAALAVALLASCDGTTTPPDASQVPDLTAPAGTVNTCLFDMRCEKCNALGVCP